jgi:hypothetical protein
MAKPANIWSQDCLMKFLLFKFSSEDFKPLYAKRKNMLLQICRRFKSTKKGSADRKKKIGYENALIAAFAESPQI